MAVLACYSQCHNQLCTGGVPYAEVVLVIARFCHLVCPGAHRCIGVISQRIHTQ